ncbi:MAG: amidohydrolase family protein [Candidatus Latescibacterota bacterium]
MPSPELYRAVKEQIDAIPVVDTHEHIYYPEEDYLRLDCDFARLLAHYTIDDLVSAGMPIANFAEYQETGGAVLRAGGSPLDLDAKWAHIAPYWEEVKDTGYGRAARHSLQKLLEVDDLNGSTYRLIGERLRGYMKPGVYRHFLKEVCGFTHIINDVDTAVKPGMFDRLDRTIFRFVARFRQFTYAYMPGMIGELERTFNRPIRSLDRLTELLDAQFDRWHDEGRVALKIADAYRRDILYEDSPREEADAVFRRIFALRRIDSIQETLSFREARPFENYMTHRVLERAEERGLPVVIHTGYHAFTNNDLNCARPGLLVNLIMKYPRLRFHILHCGYPWIGEAASLAKMYPNVTLDLTWTQVVVPAGAREGLSHILDMVPLNKIHVFGGDHLFPESVPGALESTRENVAHVLAEKIERGHLTETRAIEIAHKLFHKNAEQIFGLEG